MKNILTQKELNEAASNHALNQLGAKQFKQNKDAVKAISEDFKAGAQLAISIVRQSTFKARVDMIEFDKTMFNHVMIDLETLGTNHDSVILSIALVSFNLNGEIGKVIVIHFDIDSCLNSGLKVKGDTIRWWMIQDEEARKEIYLNYKMNYSLDQGLDRVETFIDEVRYDYKGPKEPVFLWGNSSSFDLGILKNAFQVLNKTVPWDYWEEMDMRTITNLLPEVNITFQGVPHNPLDDCYYQIEVLTTLLKSRAVQEVTKANNNLDTIKD